MWKYIIFILVFNVLCFAQDFDIYEISDRKPVDKLIIKRQVIKPQPLTLTEPQKNAENDHKNIPESSEIVVPKKPQNVDSGKKDLSKIENPHPDPKPAAANVTNSQHASNDDSKGQNKIENTLVKHEKEKPIDDQAKTDSEDSKNPPQGVKTDVSGSKESKNSSSASEPSFKNTKHATEHPGAALRGFYVFLGLSILIIIYFIFKAFRLRPGAPPPTTVRKYGIVGRRSDMEMLPLPLAEEDDDDTLFDMGTQVNR